MARSNEGQVVRGGNSGLWVILTPAVDIGAKDFSFFGGRRIIKIDSSFKKKNLKKKKQDKLE